MQIRKALYSPLFTCTIIFPVTLHCDPAKLAAMPPTTRRSRHIASSDDEDHEFSKTRSRKPVSYSEETDDENDNELKDEPSPEDDLPKDDPIDDDDDDDGDRDDDDDADGDADDDDDEDDDVVSRKRSRRTPTRRSKRLRSHKGGSDDSDFKEEELESSEPSASEVDFEEDEQRLRERQFVASDDEGSGYYDYKKPSKRRTKSRSRSVEPRRKKKSGRPRTRVQSEDEDYDEGHEPTIDEEMQQEINDLYDSSPDEADGNVKHKLREREKINYTMPPPITNENQLDALHPPPFPQPYKGRGRKNVGNKTEVRKLLYPTAGPFGGSDVVSLLGQNIPPGGIPLPGKVIDPANPTAALGNASDSDSSDDEPVPTNAAAQRPSIVGLTARAPQPLAAGGNVVNNTKIVGALSLTDKSKKKNSLSDTDPLGVDMNINFSAVGGLDGYIDQLKEMVALPLLYPELYQNFAITPPRGVLFHGPPGTGKTLMARALAASCSTPARKITFFMRKGADCLSKWVGEAERQLRLLFEEAKNQQPSIIFFDEIDGLAPVRSSKQEQIHASIVSTLLALMDGMDNRGQVIVIGATNRPDSVDPALRRPGRFDREFFFPLPDVEARKLILKIHTKKWVPPLTPVFVEKIAGLTKGYGGADLRALCTEAALNSIQRKYPQIYKSSDKLKVDPSKVKVIAKDFMRALDKIVPSSARSSSTGSSPLPERLQPLLQESLDHIIQKLVKLLPDAINLGGKKRLTNLEEAMYLDPTVHDSDGGFARQELLRSLETSRVCKPHLLVTGDAGAGQQYLGAAILNALEGFQVQNLDLATVFGDVTRTPELCIVQTFIEARRHQPSIIFIPNIDTWFDVMTQSAKATLMGLLRNLKSNEKILLLGISDRIYEELDYGVRATFGSLSDNNCLTLANPKEPARRTFFATAYRALRMKPYEFLNDLNKRPKRKLKQLPVVPQTAAKDTVTNKKRDKQQEYEDKRLKNVLKIKLAGLMDLFKNRYKRFRKPIIDESFLHHLFEPSILENPLITYEVAYVKSELPDQPNMIKELATGKFFHNMELDTIEERIWNGYYSEAKQFLKDIRMIVRDSINSGDRERILKANEMLTNAQFGIDDFNTPEFANACKELHARETAKQKKLLEEYNRLSAQLQVQEAEAQKETDLANGQPLKVLGLDDSAVNGTVDVDSGAGDNAGQNAGENAGDNGGDNGDKMEVDDALKANEDTDVNDEKKEEAKEEDEKDEAEEEEEEANEERKEAEETEEAKEEMEETNESKESNESSGEIRMESPKSQRTSPEAESESEAEEGFEVESEREVEVPQETEQFFQEEVVQMTAGFTVERLELVMARMMEVIWEDRDKWSKSDTMEKLHQVIKQMAE